MVAMVGIRARHGGALGTLGLAGLALVGLGTLVVLAQFSWALLLWLIPPVVDLESTIVRSATPANIDTVMIDGRILKRHRELVAFDVAPGGPGGRAELARGSGTRRRTPAAGTVEPGTSVAAQAEGQWITQPSSGPLTGAAAEFAGRVEGGADDQAVGDHVVPGVEVVK
jgi:hypothetical protein